MRKTILTIVSMFAILSCACVLQEASADGIAVVRLHKKARPVLHVTCGLHRCVVHPRRACPGGYSCSSLYGAYGPFGGASYWSRYTYDARSYRW